MITGITLSINDRCVHVSWDNDLLTETLTKLFVPWQLKNKKNFTGKSCDINIVSLPEGFILISPSLLQTVCHTEHELVSTLEFFITKLACEIFEPYLMIHSAVVDLNGTGIMIAGEHGSGKTTLALTAISSGFAALTDEVGVILDDLRSVTVFPRPFRVKSDSLRLKPSIIPSHSFSYPVSDDFSYIFFEDYYVNDTTLHYVIFSVRRKGDTVLQDIGEVETLRCLLPQGFNFYKAPDGRICDLIRFIKNVKTLKILYQNNWDAVSVIRDRLIKDI